MSAALLILELVFATFGYLISAMGLATLLAGVVVFIALPVVPLISGRFHAFARMHMWLATGALKRGAIVVTEHGDLLLKKMEFDDLGVEKIKFSDDTKEFEDPAGSIHPFKGIKFAFADEKHGVLFDPRHAALGDRKHESKVTGDKEYESTTEEYEAYNVYEWKKGVYDFAANAHEIVNLGRVRELIDGGERAEYPQRTEEFYKKSQDPYKSGPGAARVLMIILALVAPFGLMWFAATQGGGAGGGSTVGYALGWLALVPTLSGTDDIDWPGVATALFVFLTPVAVFLALAVLVSPIQAIITSTVFVAGLLVVPVLTFVLRMSTRMSEPLARQLWKMGMKGYERPVMKWTPREYVLVDERDLDLDEQRDVHWYGLLGSVIGFTFAPGSNAWGPATADVDELEERKEQEVSVPAAVTDGGETTGIPTDLPSEYVRAPSIRRASILAAFLPKRFKNDRVYVRSGIAFSQFSDSATGKKSMNKLTQAKEVHGGESTMNDRTLMYLTVGCGLFSFLSGIVVFFVL